MKIVHRSIEKDGEGSVKVRAEDPEDLWHAYHLIVPGDGLQATTFRKVQKESSTGSVDAERLKINITIQVETVDYDVQGGLLRVAGKNIRENDFVKLGAYHTIEIELHRNFTIFKKCWDTVFLDRLNLASNPSATADAAAVIMQEGLAYVCLLTNGRTIVRGKIEMSIPRKHKGITSTVHEKGQRQFYETIMNTLLREIDFAVIRVVLLASPGFVKDQFFEFLVKEAQSKGLKNVLENQRKFLLVHSSSGHKHALNEVLADPTVASQLADTKAAAEVRVMKEFREMLNSDPDRAVYGPKHVLLAQQQDAIQKLMVTDELFRSSDLKTRQHYVKLVESVRASGGEVHVFSNLHVSGEQLQQLTGVAAILRFPLPGLDDDTSDDDDDADDRPSTA